MRTRRVPRAAAGSSAVEIHTCRFLTRWFLTCWFLTLFVDSALVLQLMTLHRHFPHKLRREALELRRAQSIFCFHDCCFLLNWTLAFCVRVPEYTTPDVERSHFVCNCCSDDVKKTYLFGLNHADARWMLDRQNFGLN